MIKILRRGWELAEREAPSMERTGTERVYRYWSEESAIQAAASLNQSRAGLTRRYEVRPR